jgi:hypothetical protein
MFEVIATPALAQSTVVLPLPGPAAMRSSRRGRAWHHGRHRRRATIDPHGRRPPCYSGAPAQSDEAAVRARTTVEILQFRYVRAIWPGHGRPPLVMRTREYARRKVAATGTQGSNHVTRSTAPILLLAHRAATHAGSLQKIGPFRKAGPQGLSGIPLSALLPSAPDSSGGF